VQIHSVDFTSETESLFRRFAQRHSLAIEKIEEPNVELLMRVPKQHGLSFELTLCGQNRDEISIGFEGFWSYFFPFEKVSQVVADVLDALVVGDARLSTHTQLGHTVKRVLEKRSGERWVPVYIDRSRFKMPFIRTDVTHTCNLVVRM
jgi:hypothetical protein